MATLLSLPAELIINISSHLDTKELGPLRRSCKQLETHLFESFAKEFFSKRQFMIEHASLKTLVEISNHPTLSQRLVEVLISTEMFDHPTDVDPQCSSEYTSREWLLRTGLARDMLSEAFSKLSNLRSVGLRDYNATGRVREGPNGRWRSYGWSANPNMSSPLKLDQSPSTLFCLIMWALGSAPAFPADMQVILRKGSTLVPHAFRVDAVNAPVISRLKSLSINLQADDIYGLGTPQCEDLLRQFLYTATDLKVLRLNFDLRRPAASRLLDWLGVTSATPTPSLCNLKTLEIGMATVSASSLISVLARFKLESFSLWRVTLLSTSQSQAKSDQWARFLDDLSKATRVANSIQRATIGKIEQSYHHQSPHAPSREKVMFCPDRTEDKAKLNENDLQNEVKFRARYGFGVSTWLESISERTYVRSLHAPPLPVSSEEEDDQSEDQDSDEEMEEDEDEDEEEE